MDLQKIKTHALSDPGGFISYLGELVSADQIDHEVALGIYRYTVTNGLDNLSEAQWFTLIKRGLLDNGYYIHSCERCKITMPWSEMFHAVYYDEDRLCSYCRHTERKMNS